MKWTAALAALAMGCMAALAVPSHGQTSDDEECRKSAEAVECTPQLRSAFPTKPSRSPRASVSSGSELRASRSFVGPHVVPPGDLAAYGIVAFPYLATSRTWERHKMVCDAYVATLPRSQDLSLPNSQQMITVWPLRTEQIAAKLTSVPGSDACREAVDHYDLATSIRALKDAQRAGQELGFRRGPFLLAWAPSASKGEPDVLVLVADLSEKAEYDDVLEIFGQWRSRIEQNPDLWMAGWSADGLKLAVREWADRVGPAVLKVLWKN